ncbi:MAG: phage capsid protein [Alphaproteobacteria bacterium]
MSTQITQAFVQHYRENVIQLAQQKTSRLRAAVSEEKVTGEAAYFDLIGASAAQKRTTRHGDTPLVETPHTRRKAVLTDYEWADLIDRQDQVRMLSSMQSEYVQAGGMAMGRAIDDVIIAAFNATAITGKDGTGSQAFPAGQQVGVGAAGLTLTKLRAAAKLLDQGEVEKEDRFIVTSAEQIDDLLGDTQVTSSDYNTVKALKHGEIDSFLGFRFLHSERLPVDGNGDRLCFAWQKRGMKLAFGEDVVTKITERSDKSYAMQVYLCMTLGAVRMEEARVVEIACAE